MDRKLTLSEIAAIYRVTPKTFSKDVKEKNIPHERIGREMRFVLSRVERHLEVIETAEPAQSERKAFSRRRKENNKFAELLGL